MYKQQESWSNKNHPHRFQIYYSTPSITIMFSTILLSLLLLLLSYYLSLFIILLFFIIIANTTAVCFYHFCLFNHFFFNANFFSFFSSFCSNPTNTFPALRDHNENKAFQLFFVLSLPYVVCNLQIF